MDPQWVWVFYRKMVRVGSHIKSEMRFVLKVFGFDWKGKGPLLRGYLMMTGVSKKDQLMLQHVYLREICVFEVPLETRLIYRWTNTNCAIVCDLAVLCECPH